MSYWTRWSEGECLTFPAKIGQRAELVDGSVLLSPADDARHQSLGFGLCRELDRLAPEKFEIFHEANVRMGSDRILIPDIVVTDDQSAPLVFDATSVVLVGEVVSPSSRAIDRFLKPALCAEAKIPWYLRVERDRDLRLVLCRRRDDESYEVHATARSGEHLELPDLECTIEVDALLRRRG